MFYGNADGFKEYIAMRGKSFTSAMTDDKIDEALLIASEWIDGQYETSFVGYKTDGYEQERSWPRTAATSNIYPYHLFANNEIPDHVIKATYEAAHRLLVDGLDTLQQDYTPNQYKSVSVSGAVSVEYNTGISDWGDIQKQIPIIQNLLSDLIDETSGDTLSSLSGKAVRV